MALLRIKSTRLAILLALAIPALHAQQDDVVPPERASKPPVSLEFTPPAVEGAIVLGIFDDGGHLVRTLRPESDTPDLVIATDGYVTKWDGRDQKGAACAPARYHARGYVVGDAVKVEGVAFHFNDWMADEHIPATAVALRRWPNALGVELTTAAGPVYATIQSDGKVTMCAAPPVPPSNAAANTGEWRIVQENGQAVVKQVGPDGAVLRTLKVPPEEPQPVEVIASADGQVILVKETAAGGIERVRMLQRLANQQPVQNGGHIVADWEVVFEHTLEPCANFGVVGGKLVADAGSTPQVNSITASLVENVLEPGKAQKLRLTAAPLHPGSAWVTDDGLDLIDISSQGQWNRFAIGNASDGGMSATLYQGDGFVVEEFTIAHLDQIASFDVGSFLLAPVGQ
jgi:hypothetical protein